MYIRKKNRFYLASFHKLFRTYIIISLVLYRFFWSQNIYKCDDDDDNKWLLRHPKKKNNKIGIRSFLVDYNLNYIYVCALEYKFCMKRDS